MQPELSQTARKENMGASNRAFFVGRYFPMRWFKHLTETRQDERVARLIDRAGYAGYGLFWAVLEVIASQIEKGSGKCSVCYPVSRWAAALSLQPQNVRRQLAAVVAAGLLEMRSEGAEIELSAHNLLKYRDEWQSRLGSHSGARIQIQNTDIDIQNQKANADAPLPSFFFKGQNLRITESQHKALCDAFPWVDLQSEYRKADAWLVTNPDRHIKRVSQFVYAWMSRIPKPEAQKPMIRRARVPFDGPIDQPNMDANERLRYVSPESKALLEKLGIS
jgi:hypothetical protein